MTDSQSPPLPAPEPTAREQRRAQLLDAAAACFTEHGYAATPVSAIVKAAGVSQGTFYLYFQSKEDVLADLRRAVFRDYERSLVAVAALDAPADERLARAIVAMGDAVTRNRAMEQVFRAAERGESTVLDGRTRLARNAVAFLVEGARSKAFHAEDPELVAHFVVTLFDEVLFPAVMSERPAPLARVVEQGVRFTLRALGVPPARVEAVVVAVLAGERAAPPSARDLPLKPGGGTPTPPETT
jgi:AcrR family transcriptional regulator